MISDGEIIKKLTRELEAALSANSVMSDSESKHIARISELEGAISKIQVMDKRKYLSRAAWPMMDAVIEAKKTLGKSND